MQTPACSPGQHVRLFEAIALAAFVAATLALGGCKTIPEGRSSVNEIQIRGADAVDEGDIKEKIATTESPKLLWLFRGIVFEYSVFDRSVLQRDLARVEAFYRSKGYYDVHVRAGRLHRLDDKHVRIEIIVEEGQAVIVHDVRIEGLEGLPADVAEAARRAANELLLTNEPFEEESFEKTEGLVRRALADRGYAHAKVTSDAAVDIVAHKTHIVFSATPGPKCVFGDVTIEGLGKLPTTPTRRTIDIDPGEPYSEQALDDAQQALLDLGVFASVELVPEIPEEPDKAPARQGPVVVPIHVKLEPSRLRTVRLGGGIEFDSLKSDVHGLIGWESRNFLGGLRSLTITFRPGVVFYPTRFNNFVWPTDVLLAERLRVEFKQPGLLPARTTIFERPEFNVYPVLLDPDPPEGGPVIGYGELRNSLGVERSFTKLYAAISYNTQIAYPFSYVGARDPTLDLVVISYPELYATLDLRDDKIRPHKGIFIGSTFQIAGQIFQGDADDFKVQPEVRGYVPISKTVVWASRVSVGFLHAQSYGDIVQSGPHGTQPPSAERTRDYQLTFFRGFFSGGPSSNRGYPIRGVGPYDVVPFLNPEVERQRVASDCGDQCRSPTGGFTLWEASTELRFMATEPLSFATFCDASDVSPHTNDIRLKHPHLSCGGGVRFDTPAGPLRLDVGYRIPGLQVIGGLTPDEKEPRTFIGGIPIAVHIGIGEAY